MSMFDVSRENGNRLWNDFVCGAARPFIAISIGLERERIVRMRVNNVSRLMQIGLIHCCADCWHSHNLICIACAVQRAEHNIDLFAWANKCTSQPDAGGTFCVRQNDCKVINGAWDTPMDRINARRLYFDFNLTGISVADVQSLCNNLKWNTMASVRTIYILFAASLCCALRCVACSWCIRWYCSVFIQLQIGIQLGNLSWRCAQAASKVQPFLTQCLVSGRFYVEQRPNSKSNGNK